MENIQDIDFLLFHLKQLKGRKEDLEERLTETANSIYDIEIELEKLEKEIKRLS